MDEPEPAADGLAVIAEGFDGAGPAGAAVVSAGVNDGLRSLLATVSALLPTVSAGSGVAVLEPASVDSLITGSASVAAEAPAAETPAAEPPAVGALAGDFPADPFDLEPLDPLASLPRCPAPERELPVLVRGGDMMPLSPTVSGVTSSGSAFEAGGAMISGG